MKSKIALLLTFMMIFSLTACGGPSESDVEESQLASVLREAEPPVLEAGNEATAIALHQYVYTRLLTEQLAAEDLNQMSEEERKVKIDELAAAWEVTAEYTTSAEELTNQAVLELGGTASLPISNKIAFSFLTVVYAADEAKEFDQVAWAEKMTKQYDELKGAKRYNQLAKQLGVDAKTAYEQMTIAQTIIHKGATADADWNNKVVNILQATKTTCKVSLLGLSLVATGGSSVTALEGAGFIASGVECAIEVADTSSTIILGEGNKVSIGFNELKKITAPVTSVIGLLNFDLTNLMERTKGTGDALVYISDSVADLYYENKVLGVQISTTKEGGAEIKGQGIDITGLKGEDLKSALEAAGFPLQETPKDILDLIKDTWDPDIEVMKARMEALTAALTEEVRTEPLDVAAGSIFGTYHCVTTYQSGEVETSAITIRDNGGGTVVWITEDGDETILDYNESTNEIVYFSDVINLEMQFSVGVGGVTGSGRMYGELWDKPLDASLEMVKQ